MEIKIDRDKISYFILTLILSCAVTYYAHPFIKNNQDAINILVTIFSILVGFLLAIITLVGDPKTLPSGSWKAAELASKTTFNRLARQKLLFIAYLITLTLIFISMLLRAKFEFINYYVEHIYLFFASIAMMYSFRLPYAIIELQKERIDQEIEERRKAEGINDDK